MIANLVNLTPPVFSNHKPAHQVRQQNCILPYIDDVPNPFEVLPTIGLTLIVMHICQSFESGDSFIRNIIVLLGRLPFESSFVT